MNNTDTAIIASAGRGSRLGHNIPKACVEVGGKTLLQWQLEALQDFRNIFIIIGYRYRFVLDELFCHRNNATVIINHQWEETNTAYSISLASKLIDKEKAILTVDGDTIFSQEDVKKMTHHQQAIGVTKPMSDEGVYVEVNNDNSVIHFTRDKTTKSEWSGMSLVPAGFFHDSPDCFVYEIIEQHLPIKAERINLVEIDTPADLERARRMLRYI